MNRIKLTGQEQWGTPVKIDRALPFGLAPYMYYSQWVAFCDNIDNALEPLGDIGKRSGRTLMCGCGVHVAIIGTLGGTGILFHKPWSISIYFILHFLFIVVASWRSAMIADQKVSAVMEDLQKILSTESAKTADVSFHLKEDQSVILYNSTDGARVGKRSTYSIEYCIAASGLPTAPSPGIVTVSNAEVVSNAEAVSTTPVFGLSSFDNLTSNAEAGMLPKKEEKSLKERLKELESVKGMITDDEYKQKKREILASL